MNKPKRGQLRIIGGQWRGRKLPVPEVEGLRPTGDRMRETLFNWLQPVIEGSHCLDLFAGSGALGLEALSRGAAAVTFVDQSAAVTRQLAHNLDTLGCDRRRATLVSGSALQWLAGPPPAQRFDVVFLDPPFALDILAQLLPALTTAWMAESALIYVEADRHQSLPPLPEGWSVSRQKQAGQVNYWLLHADGRE